MGLWIRTQNDEMIECKRIMPMGNKIMEQHYADNNSDDYTVLGEYQDGEVIQVIDLIQDHLNSIIPEKVFQIPPKGFTKKKKPQHKARWLQK